MLIYLNAIHERTAAVEKTFMQRVKGGTLPDPLAKKKVNNEN